MKKIVPIVLFIALAALVFTIGFPSAVIQHNGNPDTKPNGLQAPTAHQTNIFPKGPGAPFQANRFTGIARDTLIEQEVINQYRKWSLSGNIKPMTSLLREHQAVSTRLSDLAQKFNSRFISRSERFETTGDEFVDAVISAYRQYWVRVLMQEIDLNSATSELDKQLNLVLSRYGFREGQNPVQEIRIAFADRGYFLLGGITSPYRELMVWKNQDEETYSVELTDGIQDLTVVLLDDFVSHGWLSFASLEISASAGWATSDKLFVVVEEYDLESEGFAVSYLKHEARHLADFRLFPELESFDLEYRAKLTELVYADETSIKLLNKFIVEANNNSEAPHPRANYAVMSVLSDAIFSKPYEDDLKQWRTVNTSVVQQTAKALLEKHTHQLQ